MKTSVLKLATILVPVLLGNLFQSEPLFASDCPTPDFLAAGSFGAGNLPSSVATGDFNRDGKPDLAVANKFSANVSVLLGTGDGTFQAAVNYPAGLGASSVSTGDFNADTKLDLAVANASDNNVSVLLGQGDGTFLLASNYATGDVPSSVAVSDFNGDNKADLAVANRASGDVSVLLGMGDGTFLTASNYAAGADPLFVAVGDFNQDNKPDLVVCNSALFQDPSSISVFLGHGDGTFEDATNYSAGRSPRSVAVGDFNGDSKPDLAVANYGGFVDSRFTNSSVSVLLGNGNGTFQVAVDYSAGSGPLSVAVADFNADDKADLVMVNNKSATASVLSGNGDGTFQAAANYVAGANPVSLAVGNFDGDTWPDLAVVRDGGILALRNTTYETCMSADISLTLVHNEGSVTVSWPFPSTQFILESTLSLSTPNWLPVPGMPLINNDRLEVTVSIDQQERYFRLRK